MDQKNHDPARPPPPNGGDRPGGGGEAYGNAMDRTWMMGTPHAYSGNTPSSIPPPVGGNPNNMNYGYHSPPSGDGSSFPTAPPPPTTISSNPYVIVAPATGSSEKGPGHSADMLFKVLGQATKKAGGVAGSVWQHLRTSPHPTDAAIARLTQGTKVFAEGGQEKMYEQSFGVYPGEKLRKSFACYISTSSGPVIGTLYLSTTRITFCSDNPICQNAPPSSSSSPPAPLQGNQNRTYYKIIVQLEHLKGVYPSANRTNPEEKYIQIVTVDGNEFWFMGFVSYDKALMNLTEALQNLPKRYY